VGCDVPVDHGGKIYRELGTEDVRGEQSEIRSMLVGLQADAARDLERCPTCRRAEALVTVKVAAVGALDERRCKYCNQVVLESTASPDTQSRR
jgi:hypothetical protein